MSSDLFSYVTLSTFSLVGIHSNEANSEPFPQFVANIKVFEYCNVLSFPVVFQSSLILTTILATIIFRNSLGS